MDRHADGSWTLEPIALSSWLSTVRKNEFIVIVNFINLRYITKTVCHVVNSRQSMPLFVNRFIICKRRFSVISDKSYVNLV